jgi:hypothetical protein
MSYTPESKPSGHLKQVAELSEHLKRVAELSGHLKRVAELRSGEGFMLLFWMYNLVVSRSRDLN